MRISHKNKLGANSRQGGIMKTIKTPDKIEGLLIAQRIIESRIYYCTSPAENDALKAVHYDIGQEVKRLASDLIDKDSK